MKKFCALVVLTLSITISAYADCATDGHMGCPGATSATTQTVPTNNNDMEYPGLKEIALGVLQSILSLS